MSLSHTTRVRRSSSLCPSLPIILDTHLRCVHTLDPVTSKPRLPPSFVVETHTRARPHLHAYGLTHEAVCVWINTFLRKRTQTFWGNYNFSESDDWVVNVKILRQDTKGFRDEHIRFRPFTFARALSCTTSAGFLNLTDPTTPPEVFTRLRLTLYVFPLVCTRMGA